MCGAVCFGKVLKACCYAGMGFGGGVSGLGVFQTSLHKTCEIEG